MATAMASLQPITFSARSLKTPLSQKSIPSADIKGPCAAGRMPSPNTLVANPSLTIIEVENLLRDNVRAKYHDLQQAFHTYDANGAQSVTKGEFRRVLESFCFPLTTEQFESIVHKVNSNPNATICYKDFLDKFGGGMKTSQPEAPNISTDHNDKSPYKVLKVSRSPTPKEINTDLIEKTIREKLQKNLKNAIKALRLYDYNRDGHVQRHELRKVLENYCFKMTDQQFDKFYQRYDFHHRGIINYKDFLMRLGLSMRARIQPNAVDTAQTSMVWQENRPGGVVLRPEDITAGMNMFQIETEFRKKMKENYVNLKRMFMSFDRHLDGHVTLEDLKSVLNNFTLPMSDQLFSQLMERLGVKATGKISWEAFLDRFQDAQGPGNGQTIPIKPAHKFFPIRGTDEVLDLNQVIRLLRDHVLHAYSSFKQAFLQLDKNRDGKISRKELRRVIENFKFRLTDGQFRELMLVLDPQHTNSISYHKFLSLFEEKESTDAHKWLKSEHRYNDEDRPAIIAWETVEDLLCEKIGQKWKDVSTAVVKNDPLSTGTISPKVLRRILEKYTLPLSDNHYENLTKSVENKSGAINYHDFFNRLGVTVRPGDLEGLSSQITDENKETVERMHDEHFARQDTLLQNAANRTDIMSSEEIITRIKDRISQKSAEVRSVFQKYDKRHRGKISKTLFRELLEDFGFIVSNEQFQELCSKLQFHGGHMTYIDFVRNFEDPRMAGSAEVLLRTNNHHVNAIRGDEYGMTAEQAEKKLLAKLRENFEGLRGAFYKFDDDHNGLVTKKNFRRMLNAFMIIMTDSEFEKLCSKLGVNKSSRIGYLDFLNAFEVKDTEEGHKWLNSCHKYNETVPTRLMDAEYVHQILCTKAHRQYSDLAKAFRTIDASGMGAITRDELREVLYKFMLPMSQKEFDKLWAKYDPERKGGVTHKDFLQNLQAADKFTPGDLNGPSTEIHVNSQIQLQDHNMQQQAKHEQITENQANTVTAFTVDHVLQQLKDKIRDVYEDPYSAFCKFDRRRKGFLNVNDFQKVLIELNYFVDDDQFYDLLQRVKLNDKNSKLTYDDFLRIFDEGHKDNFQPAPKDHPYPQENENLPPDESVEKMRKKIDENAEILAKAFQSFDPQSSGRINIKDLRSVLDNFCFKMTNAQFKSFLSTVTVTPEGLVFYQAMLDEIGGPSAEMVPPYKWVSALESQLDNLPPQPMTMEDVNQHLRELITSKFTQIAKAFSDIDFAKIGVVSRDDFQNVIYRFTVRLTKEQFDKLWESLNVNEFGNLDYTEFMRAYTLPDLSAGMNRPQTASRPHTALSEVGRDLRRLSTPARPFTPLVNAEDVEKKVKDKIRNNWKDIRKQCRNLDPDNTGQVTQENFKAILRKQDVSLSEDQLHKLLIKYDLNNNFMFCYQDFLKNFMLNTSLDDVGVQVQGPYRPLQSMKRLSPKNQQRNKPDSNTAEGRLRRCVLEHWKEMRREFRTIDRNAIGVVSHDEFRQVLRQFNINLSEEEFSDALKIHDHNQSGMINYNEFVRAFLKSA